MVEHEFEMARQRAGTPIDSYLLMATAQQPLSTDTGTTLAEQPTELSPSFKEVYDAYMSDPTHDWSPRTRLAYETTRRLALAVLGDETPICSISRARCRAFIETLRWLPRNASKRFPGMSPVEAAQYAKAADLTESPRAPRASREENAVRAVVGHPALLVERQEDDFQRLDPLRAVRPDKLRREFRHACRR